jgi:hypothetical protein
MQKLNNSQKYALNLLAAAFSELSKSWDEELGVILQDLGVLPQRDLTEASSELFHCLENGEIGTREELWRKDD